MRATGARGGTLNRRPVQPFASVALAWVLLAGSAQANTQTLRSAVLQRLRSIDEFQLLAERAEKLGLRAWLFGGSAAAVAYHARKGMDEAVEFPDVFRWNQDVDVVVDAVDATLGADEILERARQLEEGLAHEFPHLPGERPRWEVRLLRHARGDKAPLLGSDIWRQHNDTGSIGLIEVTEPRSGEPRFRDGNAWAAPTSRFLEDASQGRIRFLHAEGHGQTARSEDGLNPPIFSVVRFLTKKHQYGLATDEASLAHLNELAKEFRAQVSAESFPHNGYVSRWLHHNVRKMIANAEDLVALWAELDRLEVRGWLAAVGGEKDRTDTVAWWLHKEPLPHRPLGEGAAPGSPTAGSLGIGRVTHFTSDLPAYEAIRRSTTFPNVFQSRDGSKGERALYGNGFYVYEGTREEPGGTYSVALDLEPDAVLGVDFVYSEEKGALVVLNRAALRLVPTDSGGDPVGFFTALSRQSGEKSANLGVLAQWRRRVASRFRSESGDRRDQITRLVNHALAGPLEASEHLLREWFLMPASANYPELFQLLLARVVEPAAQSMLLHALGTSHWRHSALGQEAIFRLLGAPADYFEGQRLEVAVASKVLRPEDAWQAGWFEAAVFRLTMLHGAEHSLVNDVFLAPGFTTSPNAGSVMKTFVQFSWKPVEAARALSGSEPWTQHPDAIQVARAFARELPALDALYQSVLWRRLFAEKGANVQSLGRLRRSLVAFEEKTRHQTNGGIYLPPGCAKELVESTFVKN